ncbi:unnamed protein product [Closterium sp. NIES-54]
MAGGGTVISDASRHASAIIVKAHGSTDQSQPQSHPSHSSHRVVSSHWVFRSLQANRAVDPSSHLVLRPLSCTIPLPGIKSFQFCVSMYGGTRRTNILCLCVALGANPTEKLDRRISHLVCSVASGEKYERAMQWGNVAVVTEEWLHACVRANGIVPTGPFHPPPLSLSQLEGGRFPVTQGGAQAVRRGESAGTEEATGRGEAAGKGEAGGEGEGVAKRKAEGKVWGKLEFPGRGDTVGAGGMSHGGEFAGARAAGNVAGALGGVSGVARVGEALEGGDVVRAAATAADGGRGWKEPDQMEWMAKTGRNEWLAGGDGVTRDGDRVDRAVHEGKGDHGFNVRDRNDGDAQEKTQENRESEENEGNMRKRARQMEGNGDCGSEGAAARTVGDGMVVGAEESRFVDPAHPNARAACASAPGVYTTADASPAAAAAAASAVVGEEDGNGRGGRRKRSGESRQRGEEEGLATVVDGSGSRGGEAAGSGRARTASDRSENGLFGRAGRDGDADRVDECDVDTNGDEKFPCDTARRDCAGHGEGTEGAAGNHPDPNTAGGSAGDDGGNRNACNTRGGRVRNGAGGGDGAGGDGAGGDGAGGDAAYGVAEESGNEGDLASAIENLITSTSGMHGERVSSTLYPENGRSFHSSSQGSHKGVTGTAFADPAAKRTYRKVPLSQIKGQALVLSHQVRGRSGVGGVGMGFGAGLGAVLTGKVHGGSTEQHERQTGVARPQGWDKARNKLTGGGRDSMEIADEEVSRNGLSGAGESEMGGREGSVMDSGGMDLLLMTQPASEVVSYSCRDGHRDAVIAQVKEHVRRLKSSGGSGGGVCGSASGGGGAAGAGGRAWRDGAGVLPYLQGLLRAADATAEIVVESPTD